MSSTVTTTRSGNPDESADIVDAVPGDQVRLDFSETGRCRIRIDCGEYGVIETWGSPDDDVRITLGTKVPTIEYPLDA